MKRLAYADLTLICGSRPFSLSLYSVSFEPRSLRLIIAVSLVITVSLSLVVECISRQQNLQAYL